MTEYPTESYTEIAQHALVDGGRVFPDGPDLIRHVFVWPDHPLTMNRARILHHRKWSEEVAEWREAFRLMATGCVPLAWCHVTVDHLTETRRRCDAGAVAPAAKAALDGIVNAGVLEDDDQAHVRTITFNSPVHAGHDALIVTLTGPAKGAA